MSFNNLTKTDNPLTLIKGKASKPIERIDRKVNKTNI